MRLSTLREGFTTRRRTEKSLTGQSRRTRRPDTPFHVRIEHMLFDGAPRPADGMIRPDLTRPGFGLAFKTQDAERFAERP